MKKVYVVYDSLGDVYSVAACEDLAYEICFELFIEAKKGYDQRTEVTEVNLDDFRGVVWKTDIGDGYRVPHMVFYEEEEILYE